jgi:hypothetical protein
MKSNQKLFSGVFLLLSLAILQFVLPGFVYAEIKLKTPSWEKVTLAHKNNEYVFLLVDNGKSKEGKAIEQVLQDVNKELGNKCKSIKVLSTDKKEAELIKFFRITDELVPVVFVIAPNGAISSVFSKSIDKKALNESIISEQESAVILNLQEGRLALLCYYKAGDSYLETARSEIKAIETYFKGMASTFYINRNDIKGKPLFNNMVEKLGVSDKITVLTLAPPGRVMNKLEGEQITRNNLLQSILASCGSGCGSGCK